MIQWNAIRSGLGLTKGSFFGEIFLGRFTSVTMQGIKRVCIFCMLTTLLPSILIILPLYLRHSKFADVIYSLAESDIVEIKEGISTIFCEQHILRMNTSFHAVQLSHSPEISKKRRKHIRLKKSMTLPDDTLEYWGFFLLKGASVALKVCSRFDGSRILVVKGERNLKTCGLQVSWATLYKLSIWKIQFAER